MNLRALFLWMCVCVWAAWVWAEDPAAASQVEQQRRVANYLIYFRDVQETTPRVSRNSLRSARIASLQAVNRQSFSKLASFLSANQAEIVDYLWLLNGATVFMPETLAADVKSQYPGLMVLPLPCSSLEPENECRGSMADQPSDWSWDDRAIGADRMWQLGYTGAGVTVAVLDSGIDGSHPDLLDKVIAQAVFSGSHTPHDEEGHGTAVAGAIAGSANSQFNVSGTAPGVSLINAKVAPDPNQPNPFYDPVAVYILAMQWSAEVGADIMVIPAGIKLGGMMMERAGRNPLERAAEAVVSELGIAVATGVGTKNYYGQIVCPASANGVLAVSDYDEGRIYQDINSKGPTDDGRTGVMLAAPGTWTMSTSVRWQSGQWYAGFDGPCFAAAHAAGALALLMQAFPEIGPEELIRNLALAADRDIRVQLPGGGSEEPGVIAIGHGGLDVAKAYDKLVAAPGSGIGLDAAEWFAGEVQPGTVRSLVLQITNQDSVPHHIHIEQELVPMISDWLQLPLPIDLPPLQTTHVTCTLTTPALWPEASPDSNPNSTIYGIFINELKIESEDENIRFPVSVNVISALKDKTDTAVYSGIFNNPGGLPLIEGDLHAFGFMATEQISCFSLQLSWAKMEDPVNDCSVLLYDNTGCNIARAATLNVPEQLIYHNLEPGNYHFLVNANSCKDALRFKVELKTRKEEQMIGNTPISLVPVQDAFTNSFYGDDNYGSDVHLKAGNLMIANNDQLYMSYLKYDISKLSETGQAPKSAVVHITVSSKLGHWVLLDLWSSLNNWTEDFIAWNSPPQLLELLDTVYVSGQNRSAEFTFEATDFVRECIARNETEISFAVKPAMGWVFMDPEKFAEFGSRESSTPTVLEITY